MESRKMVLMNFELTCRAGEGGMNWEIMIDIYTLSCVKQIASGNLLHSTESSTLCRHHQHLCVAFLCALGFLIWEWKHYRKKRGERARWMLQGFFWPHWPPLPHTSSLKQAKRHSCERCSSYSQRKRASFSLKTREAEKNLNRSC